jgi:hypothetical protein
MTDSDAGAIAERLGELERHRITLAFANVKGPVRELDRYPGGR